MPSRCRITMLLLLLLLLLPAVTQAQSGDGNSDMEPRVSCTSHIMTDKSSLTCKLVGGEDDEDDEDDIIEKMTACYNDLFSRSLQCLSENGNTLNFTELSPVIVLNVTINFQSGGKMTKMIDLKKIVKPRSPEVWNVTFNPESKQAAISVRTPYHKEYLKVKNQLFQLLIWSESTTTIQNVSSSDHIIMKIEMEHLQKNTLYNVRARAIPSEKHLQGTWSEWSETYSFFTPAEEKIQQVTEGTWETYTLTGCLVFFVVVTSSVFLFWRNKIFTYIWPNIPYPKHTLVQICNPNNGLLLNVKPEVFSALKIYSMEGIEGEPAEEPKPSHAAASECTGSNLLCSTQSSDCSRSTNSASTEELELCMLLSRSSSSDGEDSLQSTSPSPIAAVQLEEREQTPLNECSNRRNEDEVLAVSKREEAYVTMSSFYQINRPVEEEK